MSFIAKLQRAREILAQQGRLSTRALERELAIAGDELEELIEELVDVQQVARREGKILVWTGAAMQGVMGLGGYGVEAPSSGPLTPNPVTPNPLSEARKVISVIFADLMGSTALQEGLDPESVNRVMDAYYQAVRGPVEDAGGTVVQLLGDGVLCAFGIPQIAQDDALRAVRAAVGIQQAFREFVQTQQWLKVPIGLRVAVNTGEVVVSDEHPAGIGDPLNVAARLQQEARDGEVVIGQATRRLVADAVTLEQAGTFTLKGRAGTVTAYRVVSLARPAGAITAAFVGRDDELARIIAVYDAARATPAARLAVVLGSPGLGKSRLIEEVARRLGDASVVTAQCDAAGGATFAPVAEALRTWLGAGRADPTDRSDPSDPTDPSAALAAVVPEGPDHARIIAGITALLAGSPASPEETFFVIRRFLTALAQTKPIVLVIDDLHWAEPLLLDLVEHLIQWGSGVPLFVLVGARPELRDLRSSLVTPGGHVAEVVTLSGLDAGAAMRLAANVIGAADLPAAVAAKVLATSEGNPLFVGELVRMLVDEGAIERQGERWIVGANLAALEMPPTIHALLAARIERLRPEERRVLERAAVVGRHFSRSAVAALLSRNDHELDARLEALRRSELIESDTGWFLGEPLLRFHHVLIRDAAYRRLLKGTRAELHAQLADWIEGQVGEAAEHDETIGWHLEQAHQHLRELGPIDAKGAALGERAAQRLAAAGRRALARDDVPVAANLLGRAIERLDVDAPARAELALDWCEALLSAGDVGRAAGAIAELARFAVVRQDASDPKDSNDRVNRHLPRPSPASHASPLVPRLHAWHTCFTGQLTALTAPQHLQATVAAVAAAAEELAKLGDAAGEAKAHSVHAQALARLGKVGACEAALDKALAAARKAGDRRRANAVLAGAPVAALWGPSPVTRASGRCLDVVRVLRITQGAPAVEAVALSCQGVLEALRGRTEAARRMIASSRKMVEELGIAHRLFEADVFAGRIALLEGDAAEAERTLRDAYDGLRELGLGIDAARASALLARAQLAQGKVAEAETLSHESEALAGDDLQAAIAWRGVRAEALASRGDTKAAVELARAAVAIAAATDALLDHADARLALAAALRAAGCHADADSEDRRAKELWEAKGATLLAERARQRDGAEPDLARPSLPVGEHGADDIPAHLTSGNPLVGEERTLHRRVRPNTATATMARMEAAFAARDLDAVVALLADSMENIDHPTGSTYGREGQIDSSRRMMRTPGLQFRIEVQATLGDRLCLMRRQIVAHGTAGGAFDVGAYEMEHVGVCAVDADGRCRSFEIFAADRLGNAITRLYERYAELLADAAERARAAATADSVAVWNGLIDVESLAASMRPSIECVDTRPLHTWSARGRDEFLGHWREQIELTSGFSVRDDDVLALAPDALLVRQTYMGTVRATGGPFENLVLVLLVFAAPGLLARAEVWEPNREAEALARFDELTGVKEPLVLRRVRANRATMCLARFERVVAARDADRFAELLSDQFALVHHATVTTYGRRGMVTTWRSLFRANHLAFRYESLATLGDSLSLHRHWVNAEGFAEEHLKAAGAIELEEICLSEVGADDRVVRFELFAPDHLGDAIARLYARYAELLPEGATRLRAEQSARSVTFLMGTRDPTQVEAAFAPDIETNDHRMAGFGHGRGIEWMRRLLGSAAEVADGVAEHVDDVLALDPGALLLRCTLTGTERVGGGAFASTYLRLRVLDAHGLVTQAHTFDAGHETEALALFDALTSSGTAGPARRRVQENTAIAVGRRYGAAALAGDMATIEALSASDLTVRHHPTGALIDFAGGMQRWRMLTRARGLRIRTEPIATLGDSLALGWDTTAFEQLSQDGLEFGASESRYINLLETNERRLAARVEVFAEDRLGDAIVCLYQRYAKLLPEGRVRTRAAATARAIAAMVAPPDLARYASALAPTVDFVDHRTVGFASGTGADKLLRGFASLLELAENVTTRVDDVLALEPGTVLLRWMVAGVDRTSGGAFESPCLLLWQFGEDGRVMRDETFDAHRQTEALARFDELSGAVASEESSPPFGNTAWRTMQRIVRAWKAHDLNACVAEFSPSQRMDDRRRIMRIEMGHDDFLTQLHMLFDQPASRWDVTLMATRGEHLCLQRTIFSARVAGGGGPLADEHLTLTQVEADGRCVAIVTFDLEDLDAAYAELDRRWDAGDFYDHRHAEDALTRFDELVAGQPGGTAGERFANAATASAGPVIQCLIGHDWDGFRDLFAEDFHMSDRRRVVQLELDRDRYVAFTREVAEGRTVRNRSELVATRGERLAVMRSFYEFTDADVGPSEIAFLLLMEVDERGRIVANVRWDLDDIDAVYPEIDARWAASEALAHPLASRWIADYRRCFAARDWAGMASILAPDLVSQSHRLVSWGTVHGPAGLIATLQAQMELAPDTQARFDHMRTKPGGMLLHYTWRGTHEGGAFENVLVAAIELDARGLAHRIDVWEAEQLEQAQARFEELRPDPLRIPANTATRALEHIHALYAAGDWEALRALCASVVYEDRRPFSQITGACEQFIASLRFIFDAGFRPRMNILATAGDRLMLHRNVWTLRDEGHVSEVEALELFEVDADGALVASIIFDPGDRAAAEAELVERCRKIG